MLRHCNLALAALCVLAATYAAQAQEARPRPKWVPMEEIPKSQKGADEKRVPPRSRIATTTSDPSQLKCPGDKRALVISGGGVNGAYQVGVLWYLVNVLECRFDHIFGTSTGAITAAALAQANNLVELKERVEQVKHEYASLSKPSQLIDDSFVAWPRLALPKWLGGSDGLWTLAPIESRLRTYIRPESIQRDRLSIVVFSLQAGALNPHWYRVENIFDLVIGSASIPVAIEPRRARVWVRAAPIEVAGDELTLDFYAAPGLPDPNCELQLKPGRSVRCQQIEGSMNLHVSQRPRTVDDPDFFSSRGKLRLSGLSDEDRKLIQKEVEFNRTGPAGKYIRWATRKTGNPFIDRVPPFEFSSMHQLVDGGVTDNTPLEYATRLLEMKEGFDTVFTLLSPRPALFKATPLEARGVLNVLKTSFNHGWEAYQVLAYRAAQRSLRLQAARCERSEVESQIRDWRQELAEKIGLERFKEIEASMSRQLPKRTYIGQDDCSGLDLWTFDLGQSDIEGLLSV